MRKRHIRKYEVAALEQYAQLSERFGDACAINMLCGVYVSGDMRKSFLENVFGSEIRRVTQQLSGTHGWTLMYPPLAITAAEIGEM